MLTSETAEHCGAQRRRYLSGQQGDAGLSTDFFLCPQAPLNQVALQFSRGDFKSFIVFSCPFSLPWFLKCCKALSLQFELLPSNASVENKEKATSWMPHFENMNHECPTTKTGIKTAVWVGNQVDRGRGNNLRQLVLPTPSGCNPHLKNLGKVLCVPMPQLTTSSMEIPPGSSDPFCCEGTARGPPHVLGSPWGCRATRKVAKKKLLALTPAGPAASANPQCRGALPADTGGLQHGLHVLVLRSVLGVLQALGLALGGGRGAGELAGLREERGFVVLTKKASVETASCKGGSLNPCPCGWGWEYR